MVLLKGLQLFGIKFATLRQALRPFTNALNCLFLTQKQESKQVGKQKEHWMRQIFTMHCMKRTDIFFLYLTDRSYITWHNCIMLDSVWPLTCCSRLRMTVTAWWRMSSLVWGFSLFKCSWHMRPSSLNASLMSRTRSLSRALLAILLSRSRSAFCSGFRSSSSLTLLQNNSQLSDKTEGTMWPRHLNLNVYVLDVTFPFRH